MCTLECKKKTVIRKEWRVVQKTQQGSTQDEGVTCIHEQPNQEHDQETITPVHRRTRGSQAPIATSLATPIQNSFQILQGERAEHGILGPAVGFTNG